MNFISPEDAGRSEGRKDSNGRPPSGRATPVTPQPSPPPDPLNTLLFPTNGSNALAPRLVHGLQGAPTGPMWVRSSLAEFVGDHGPLEQAVKTLAGTDFALSAISGDTGSAGNMTAYLATKRDQGGEMIMVDCPFGKQKVKEKLSTLGLTLSSTEFTIDNRDALRKTSQGLWLEHLLVTHLHSDHFREDGGRFCLDHGITVHIPPGSREALRDIDPPGITHVRTLKVLEELEAAGLLREFAPGTSKTLGRFHITCVGAMHDMPANSYLIEAGSLAAFHSGDTGAYTPDMLGCLEKAHAWLGDGNYDPQIIDVTGRSQQVTERTKSLQGHMGNHQNGDVFRHLSQGANSHQLQVAVMLHTSGATNNPDKKATIKKIVERWDADVAERYAPAISVADKGPQFLFTLTAGRKLIVPHERVQGGLLRTGFGETGLSMRLARDIEPELRRAKHERSHRLQALLEGPNLRSEPPLAEVQWRVPGEVAIIETTVPRKVDNIAKLTMCYNSRLKEFRAYIAPELLNAQPAYPLSEIARGLSEYISTRRVAEEYTPRFQVHGGMIFSTMEIRPEEKSGLAALIEFYLFGAAAKPEGPLERTKIRWPLGERLAVVETQDVIFPRANLAELVLLHNRDRKRLYIEANSDDARGKYLHSDRTAPFIQALGAYLIAEGVVSSESGITWKISDSGKLGGSIRHTGELVLTPEHLIRISELIERHLIWGDL